MRAQRQPFQYKGQAGYYADAHTGLYYCHHRYYSPVMARWMSVDPIGLEGGFNVYQYCSGDPVNRVDPSGLDALIVWGPDKASKHKAWEILAQQYASAYKANTGKSVTILRVLNLVDLKKAFGTTKNIDTFIFVGHAGVDGSYVGSAPDAHLFLESTNIPGSRNVSSSDIAKLPRTNVQKGAFMFLMGCGTAARVNQERIGQFQMPGLPAGTPSLAKAFATRFNTPVWVFEPHVTPGPAPMKASYLFGHQSWNTRQLGTLEFHNAQFSVVPILIKP